MAQTPNRQLSLQRVEGNNPNMRSGMKPTLRDTINQYSGIPKEIDKYIVKYLALTDSDFFGSNKLVMLIGKTRRDSIVVIVDENFNANFSDDKVLYYPKEKLTNFKGQSVTLKRTISGKLTSYTFIPNPYKTNFTYNSSIENEFSLMVESHQYLTGVINSNNVDHLIYIANMKPFANYVNTSTLAFGVAKVGSFSIGQIIPLGSKRIVVDSVSKYGEILYYKEVDSANSHLFTGYSEGQQVTPIDTYDIEKRNVKIPADHKFQLIDFWGTWCQPCHETLPVLKKIAKKYTALEVVGVAYDSDIELVREYIKKEKVRWRNIYQGFQTNEHPLITAMSVQVYPTFILIDDFGKVIFRGDGVEAIYEVEKMMRKLFTTKK
jgi:thiol-disulfide isomerase/thioredoxin